MQRNHVIAIVAIFLAIFLGLIVYALFKVLELGAGEND